MLTEAVGLARDITVTIGDRWEDLSIAVCSLTFAPEASDYCVGLDIDHGYDEHTRDWIESFDEWARFVEQHYRAPDHRPLAEKMADLMARLHSGSRGG